MYEFLPKIKYRLNGTMRENCKLDCSDYAIALELSDERIRAVITPKVEMELVSFSLVTKRSLGKDEWFFANGYQSWTTTKEMRAGDTMNGMGALTKISSYTKELANTTGDYHFAEYGTQGTFHSHTYTYFRNGESLEFYGSVSERTGYTIFQIEQSNNCFKIMKDVEGLVIREECLLLDIVCFSGEYDEVFDKYFGSMELRKPKVEHLSGYTSWYNYFQKIDENIILRDLDGLDCAKDETSIFQIDDGYESFVGDWLTPDPKKFPRGMKPIADAIHQKGYLAGIWIAPFSAQRASAIVKEHPDWLIKDKAGKPLLGCIPWGGAYTLDIYNDEVREHIRNFFDVILNDWGFDMVKLDFLYSEAMQPRNGKSRGMIMCEAMDFLRECVGEEKLILGCGVPLGPSFGVVDACRISCDVSLRYKGELYGKIGINNEIPSAQNAINNSIFRRHLNGRVFCSDPDVFFLRDDNLKFTFEQKLMLGKINNLFGDVLFVSDNAGDYGKREIELVKKFFRKNNAKIIGAEYVTKEDIKVRFEENGKVKNFRINLKTGKSNVKNIM